MDNLEVGTYVRTTKQGIKRIDTVFENKTVNKYGYEIGSEWDGKLYSIIKTTDIVKHSKNIVDLLEDKDFARIEFYSPRYERRVTRIFEISRVEEKYITFENMHCDLFMVDGKWGNHDARLKPIIKSILTHEQFAQMEYRLEGLT